MSLILTLAATLAACDLQRVQQPSDFRTALCYQGVSRAHGTFDDTVAHLQSRHSADPFGGAIDDLAIGLVRTDQGDPSAPRHLQRATATFARVGASDAQAFARLALAQWHRVHAESDLAEHELTAAEALIGGSANPWIKVQATLDRASMLNDRGGHSASLELIDRIGPLLTQVDSPWQQIRWLESRAVALWYLGRKDEATPLYRQALAAELAIGDQFHRASTIYNLALSLSAQTGINNEVRTLVEEGLEAARRGGNWRAETDLRLSRGQDPQRTLHERLQEIRRALEIAEPKRDLSNVCFAQRLMSHVLAQDSPVDKQAIQYWVDHSIACAEQIGSPFHLARAQINRAQRLWSIGSVRDGTAAGLETIDAIERVRDLQPDSLARAKLFGEWAFFYYRFVAFLLARPTPTDDELDTAFAVLERMKARSWLDVLDAAGVSAQLAQSSVELRQRESELQAISALQRRLSAGGLDIDRFHRLRDELVDRERKLRSLTEQIARSHEGFAGLRHPAIPRLEQIRAAVDPREALLLFGLALSGQDYGHLLVITRQGTAVYRLDNAAAIAAAANALPTVMARRDGSEAEGAVRLYQRLLEPALAKLPATVDRLLIVPDGALGRIGWAALRSADGRWLGDRFAITVIPSTTLWYGWRQQPTQAGSRLLAIGDPHPAAGDRLAALPYARREVRAAALALGSGGEQLIGSSATEWRVKQLARAPLGVWHVAAHVLLNERHPEATSIALAVGGGEDGALQVREVATLPLRDRMVVLSACSGSGGPISSGEGVLSLARAFFLAGARTVVASVSPVRDDETARLMEQFYRELAGGNDATTSMTTARRACVAHGDPPSAWADTMVMGDGNWKLTSPRAIPQQRSATPGVVVALAFGLLLSWAVHRSGNQKKKRVERISDSTRG